MGLLQELEQRAKDAGNKNPNAEISPEGREQAINRAESLDGGQTAQEEQMPSMMLPDMRSNDDIRAAEGQQRQAEFQHLEQKAPTSPEAVFTGWGNDYTTMGLGQKAGRSLMKGLATVVEMPGDLIELATLYTGALEPLSDWFYKQAEEIRDDNQVLKSVDLEDWDWGDIGTVEFWATSAAEQLPYMAALIGTSFIGGAGAAQLGTKISSKLIKKGLMRGSSETFATYGSRGAASLLDMDKMRTVAQAVGGGFTQNMLVGASAAHQAKEEALAAGLTKEQAYDVAANTYLDNAKYVAVDMASWYATFKLGGVISKGTNQVLDKVDDMSKGVGRTLARSSVNTTKLGVGATAEAIEEQFQEVYEEWIVRKNVAEAQGKEYDDYWTFFNSKEMQETRGTAAALGALFGGAGNIISGIAERKAYLDRKTKAAQENKNMVELDQESRVQKIERTISEAVVNGEQENLGLFWADMEQRGEITKEQAEDYAKITAEFEANYEEAIESARAVDGGLNEAGARVLQNMFIHKRGLERQLKAKTERFNRSFAQKKRAGATPETLQKMQEEFDAQKSIIEQEQRLIDINRDNLISGKVSRLKKGSGIQMNPATGALTIDPKVAKQVGAKEGESYTIDDMTGLTEEEFQAFRKEGKGENQSFFGKIKETLSGGLKKIRRDKKTEEEKGQEGKSTKEASTFGVYNERQATTTDDGVVVSNTVNGEILGGETPLRFDPKTKKFYTGDQEVAEADAVAQIEQFVGDKAEAAKMIEEIKKSDEQTATTEEADFVNRLAEEIESVRGQIEYLSDEKVEEIIRATAQRLDANLTAAQKKAIVDDAIKNVNESKTEEQKKAAEEMQAKEELANADPAEVQRNKDKLVSISESRLDWYNRGTREISQVQHMNRMLKEKFPRVNKGKGIDTVLLYKLHKEFGANAIAYQMGSTIFLSEGYAKRPEFFEEMSHIMYALFKDSPVIKRRIKQLLQKKAYVAQMKKDYKDQLIYNVTPNHGYDPITGQEVYVENGKLYYSVSGVEFNGPNAESIIEQLSTPLEFTEQQITKANGVSTMDQLQAMYPKALIEEKPIEEQYIILDEMFAHDMAVQAPSRYSIYFNESDRNLRKKVLGELKTKSKEVFRDKKSAARFAGVGQENLTIDGALQLFERVKRSRKEVDNSGRASRVSIAEKGNQLQLQFEEQNANEEALAKVDEIYETQIFDQSIEEEEDQVIDNGEQTVDEVEGRDESMDLDKKNFGSKRNRSLVKAFIRDYNFPEDTEIIAKEKLEGALFKIAQSLDVDTSWQFVAAIEESNFPEVQAFVAYVNEKFGKYAPNVLQGFYLELKSTEVVPIVKGYQSSNGEMAVQQALSPMEINAFNTLSRSMIANLEITSDPKDNMGFMQRQVFAAQNATVQAALNFADKATPTPGEATEIFMSLIPKVARVATDLELGFIGDPVYYDGKMMNSIDAFQLAVKRSLTNAKDGTYKFKRQEIQNFLRSFLSSHRVINGQAVGEDVNGNYTTFRVKTNTLLQNKQRIHREWLKQQDGRPNQLATYLGISPKLLETPERIDDAFIRHIVNNGLHMAQYGGFDKDVQYDNQSATYKEMTEESLMLNNFMMYNNDSRLFEGREERKRTGVEGYWQMMNVPGNSATNYMAWVPYVEYNVGGQRNVSREAVRTKKNALRYFKNPNAEEIINGIVRENVDNHRALLNEQPQSFKKGMSGLFEVRGKDSKGNALYGNLNQYGRRQLQNYVENYIYNQIMLHRALYGESQEFGVDEAFNLTQKVARQKIHGTPGVMVAKNTSLEILPVVFPEVNVPAELSPTGEARTINVMDGDEFILPEQVQDLRKKHGMNGLITQNGKWVFDDEHVVQGEHSHIQLKSMTFVLTNNFLKKNPHLKALANAMRERYNANKTVHADYVLIAAPADAVKAGKILRDNAVDLGQSNDPMILQTAMADALNNIYGQSGSNLPIRGKALRIVQNSDIKKSQIAIPIQFISALYSHAKPGTKRKNDIDNIQELFNKHRRNRLEKMLAGIDGLSKSDIGKISRKLNEIIKNSDASEVTKSLMFLDNFNMPQTAEPGLHSLAKRFVYEGLKGRQNGTMGLHVTEYAQYELDENGKPTMTANDALQPPIKKNGKIIPGGIILPAHMSKTIKEGQDVLVSRIPAHGLQTTIPMRVAGFANPGEGNRIQTNSIYTDVIGGDHDGDHLYVNAAEPSGSADYNTWFKEVFDFLTNETLFEDVMAAIDVDQIKAETIGDFEIEQENDYYKQFSPMHQAQQFRQNMNSGIGIVASTNRLGFLMRAEEVALKKPIYINGKPYAAFKNKDNDEGTDSVAFQAQQLLQVVLDNPKKHYADAMNLTPETTAMYAFLVNLGVPVADVYRYFNNEGVNAFIRASKKYSSMFQPHAGLSDIQAEAEALLQNELRNDQLAYQKALQSLETIIEIQQMTEELFAMNKILNQHNKLISDPAEMKHQLQQFNSLVNGNSRFFDNLQEFAKNPEVKHYLYVSQRYQQVAEKVSILGSPLHRKSYQVLSNSYRGYNFGNSKHRKKLKTNVQKALSSIALASNIESSEYYVNLPAQLSKRLLNIKSFPENKNNKFLQLLNIFNDRITVRYDMREKSALNQGLIEKAREDFAKLSPEIQRDLVNYDLYTNGFSGPNTLSTFFSKLRLEQLSAGIKNVMTTKVLTNDTEAQKDLLKRILASSVIQGNMSTYSANSSFFTAPKNETITFDNTKSFIDRIGYIQDIEALFKNEPFVIRKNAPRSGNESNQYLMYRPMDKTIHDSFMVDYNNAVTRKDKWEIVKEYMPQMEFEVLVDENKEFKSINRFLISSPYQVTTKGGAVLPAGMVKKKVVSGRASRKPYYDVNVNEQLSYEQYLSNFDAADTVDSKKKFSKYKADFQKYQAKAERLSAGVLAQMSTKDLEQLSMKAMKDSQLASGQYTAILNTEIGRRASVKQAKTTGIMNIDVKQDIPRYFKWLGSDNVNEKNPHLQVLYRTFENEIGEWEKAAQPELDRINQVTENLIKEKLADYPWWKQMLIRAIGGRKLYEKLYENLVEWKLERKGNQDYSEMQLISEDKAQNLSKAEREFYDVFKEMTKKYGDVAEQAGSLQHRREGYVPHMHAEWLEAMQTKGLSGFYYAVVPKSQKAKNVVLTAYDPISGREVTQPLSYFETVYLGSNSRMRDLIKISRLRLKAERLAIKGENQDGTPIRMQSVESDALLGGNQFSRFDKQRSTSAKLMPTLDLNHALTSYVRATIFRHGNTAVGGKFSGMDRLMPLVDGIIRIKAGAGARQTAELADKLFRQKKLMQQSQTTFLGKGGDWIVNKLNQATIYAGLGFNVTAAVGNIIMGKYSILRNNGGKVFALGEKRFWGMDEADRDNWLENMQKRQEFLKNVGLIDESFYYDYSVSKSKGLVRQLQHIALAPMTLSENWIQGANLLGMLSEEEYNSIQADGSHNIDPEKLKKMLADIRRTHGRGYSPNTERMMGLYSLGRSFQMFKKYLFTNFNERFGPEITNMYGEKEIGSMREFGHVARDVISGRMSQQQMKEYYEKLPKHKKDAFLRAVRGMGMFTLLAMSLAILGDDDDESSSPGYISRSARKNVQRAYNDVMKYYDITEAKRLMTPYPYYTLQNAVGNMTNDISLTRNSNVTIK